MAYGVILGKKNITQAQLNNAAPYNWLDNSDFTNLVAQAGINGKHGTTTYMADRWIVTGGTPSYTAGTGVSFNGTIVQKLEFAPSGEVTVVAGTSEGIITSNDIPANIKVQLSYRRGNQVTIDSNGQATIQWVALYEGTYSAVTAPAYHPKGYANELATCQRYYCLIETEGGAGYNTIMSGILTNAGKSLITPFFVGQNLRLNIPTVNFNGSIVVRGGKGYAPEATYDSPYSNPVITTRSFNGNIQGLEFTKSNSAVWGNITNNTLISIVFKTPSKLEFIADM